MAWSLWRDSGHHHTKKSGLSSLLWCWLSLFLKYQYPCTQRWVWSVDNWNSNNCIQLVQQKLVCVELFHILFQIFKTRCENKTVYFTEASKLGSNKLLQTVYQPFVESVSVACPVFITAVVTMFLVKFLIKQKNVRKTVLTSENPNDKRSQEREAQLDNLTVALVGVAVCFLFCVFPSAVYGAVMFSVSYPLCHAFWYTGVILENLTALNSSVNFLIFYMKLPAFRRAVKTFCGLRRDDALTPSVSVISTSLSTPSNTHMWANFFTKQTIHIFLGSFFGCVCLSAVWGALSVVVSTGAALGTRRFRVFTQMTRRQNFDARPGTDWTVLRRFPLGVMLSLTAILMRVSKILTPPCLHVWKPQVTEPCTCLQCTVKLQCISHLGCFLALKEHSAFHTREEFGFQVHHQMRSIGRVS